MWASRTLRAIVAAALVASFALLLVPASAAPDPRSSIIEIEWRTPTGYERCAGVLTARRRGGFVAWTAGHCAEQPFSIARLFNGAAVSGAAVRVLSASDSSDSAALLVAVDPSHTAGVSLAVPARTPPPLGSPLTIVGHPVSALQAPNAGRWTVTYARMGETTTDADTGSPQYEVYCNRCGPGDSGSGVFDTGGRLIGIVYGVTEIQNPANGRMPDGLYADVVPVALLR